MQANREGRPGVTSANKPGSSWFVSPAPIPTQTFSLSSMSTPKLKPGLEPQPQHTICELVLKIPSIGFDHADAMLP